MDYLRLIACFIVIFIVYILGYFIGLNEGKKRIKVIDLKMTPEFKKDLNKHIEEFIKKRK
jgi:hypothetical protein